MSERSAAGTAAAVTGPPGPGVRWAVLTGFAVLVAATQVLWLTFAPVTGASGRALGVSDGAIGDLAGIEPLVYVLLAIPTGRWTDRRFAAALSAGALFTAGGALLRCLDPASYAWVLAGQVLVAVGQPLVLNATTKVAARWFPPAQRTAAISVASAAQFVGILLAALGAGPLVDAGGLGLLLRVSAGVAVAGAVAVLVAVRVPAGYATEADPGTAGSLRWLRRDPLMWRLAGLLFIGVGVFNAVATWLDTILGDLGHPDRGGALIALMTVTGIAGAALLPGAAAKANRRRTLLLTTIAVTVAAFAAVALTGSAVVAAVALAVLGFVLLAGLPVALDWSELEAGPQWAATATGFLLLAGNLGGAVLVLVVQLFIGDPRTALAALCVVALPGLWFAAGLPRRARAHGERMHGGSPA